MRAEAFRGTVEVLDAQGEAPQARGPVGPTPTLNGTVGLLDDLEDLGPEPEERLARRPGRGRLLADPAQVQASRLQRAHAAIERGGHRDDVIDRQRPVGMRGRGAGTGDSERVVGSPSSSTPAIARSDQRTIPRPTPRPARRRRTVPS